MSNRILALSSSEVGNEAYLQSAAPLIKEFLGNSALSIAFIPFASVDKDHKAYANKVREGLVHLPYTITAVDCSNAKEVIEQSNAILVGGGNTFKLLHDLYEHDLISQVQQKVAAGIPYIGWSAGSNITGLSISTTNDMPIIQPPSFKAFAFFPFQINPHYYNTITEGFNGETRDQRLEEFLKLNPGVPVVCLPEGTGLKLDAEELKFIGQTSGFLLIMEEGKLVWKEIKAETKLSFLLREYGRK